MREQYRNITRLYNVVNNSLCTVSGKLSYNRLTDATIKLATLLSDTYTDEDVWSIGEYNEADLMGLIIGAYWHYTEWHGGQSSQGYKALSALSMIYWPNMETGPEDGTGEHCAYELLNNMAGSYYENV
jgi:hypothetical protein